MRVEPIRRDRAVDAAYPGQWVAVKGRAVVAHSQHPRDLVRQMRDLGEATKGAIVQRIPVPGEPLDCGFMG